ncbi:MAG: hypothetical protein AAGF30_03610 [Pseudomonadota bacterium]
MSETKRYRGGRAIAVVLDKLGWLAALAGIALAGIALVTADTGWIGQLAATVPGLILSIVGLIAVTVAQLTRASIDTAEAMREMIDLTRGGSRSSQPDPEARAALREAAQSPGASPDTPPVPSLGRRLKGEETQPPKLSPPKSDRKANKVHPIFSARRPDSS